MQNYQGGFLLKINEVLKHFGTEKTKLLKSGEYLTFCPAHDDKHPSLYIREDDKTGNILLKCQAGCSTEKFLINNNYKFDIPKVCNNALNEHKKHNSPAITFFEECCVMRESNKSISSSDKCTMTTIRRVFNAWCKDNIGKSPYSTTDFESEIISNIDTPFNGIRTRTSAGRYYIFTLNEETMRDYGHILTN